MCISNQAIGVSSLFDLTNHHSGSFKQLTEIGVRAFCGGTGTSFMPLLRNQCNEKHWEQLGKAVAYIPFSFFISFRMCRFMYYTNEGATSSKSKIEFHVECILCMLWFAFGRCVVSTCSV